MVKIESERGSYDCHAYVQGNCALEDCILRSWRFYDGKDFVHQPSVKFVATTAILADNSKACSMVLSGVQGVNSVINGLYLPTQETGQDGRRLYRKSGECGDQALCIEHFEGQWMVKAESDRGTGSFFASVEGDCALEECRLSKWRVYNSKMKLANQPHVLILTEEEVICKASGFVTRETNAA